MRPELRFRPAYVLVAGGLLVLAAGLHHLSGPGQILERFHPDCIQCHIKVSLHWDGMGAAAFSRGTHPVNAERLRPFAQLDAVETARLDPEKSISAERCRMCHQKQHSSWLASAHGRAFENHIFQHAFQRDRLGWCLNCHAPLWKPDVQPLQDVLANTATGHLYKEGISCIVCHVRDGEIISNTDYSAKPWQLYHPVRYDPSFGSPEFCAGCHQFNFVQTSRPLHPFVHYESTGPAMQNVVHEFYAGGRELYPQGCLECHFENGDHSLKSGSEPRLGSRLRWQLVKRRSVGKPDPQVATRTARYGRLLKQAEGLQNLSALRSFMQQNPNLDGWPGQRNDADRPQGWLLGIHLQMPRLAHHFPTGDLFRILRFQAFNSQNNEIIRYEFRKEIRVVDRQLIQDTTLRPLSSQKGAGRLLLFSLPDEPVLCQISYHLQGNIEDEIKGEFQNPAELIEVLYKGDCQDQHWPLATGHRP
ncbi:MAG: hypothetical protein KDK39_08815 [Leptospiraceae bacterium]|nr:hypothetical protein [Leptospiraceae bacterium]